MAERVDFPCPHTGAVCQQGSCPQTACLYDLDEAVWPDGPCPDCFGVGYMRAGRWVQSDSDDPTCPTCDGTGRVTL